MCEIMQIRVSKIWKQMCLFSLSPKIWNEHPYAYLALYTFLFVCFTKPFTTVLGKPGWVLSFPFHGLKKQNAQICSNKVNVKAETWTQVFWVQV
jgi:hypothetical protein